MRKRNSRTPSLKRETSEAVRVLFLSGRSTQRAARVIATLVVAMTLSACGFQLRGQAAIPFQTVRVEAPGFSAFANDLERAIRAGSKARIVDSRDQAEAVVQIVGESQEKAHPVVVQRWQGAGVRTALSHRLPADQSRRRRPGAAGRNRFCAAT